MQTWDISSILDLVVHPVGSVIINITDFLLDEAISAPPRD
jgi:hypothetical protein